MVTDGRADYDHRKDGLRSVTLPGNIVNNESRVSFCAQISYACYNLYLWPIFRHFGQHDLCQLVVLALTSIA